MAAIRDPAAFVATISGALSPDRASPRDDEDRAVEIARVAISRGGMLLTAPESLVVSHRLLSLLGIAAPRR